MGWLNLGIHYFFGKWLRADPELSRAQCNIYIHQSLGMKRSMKELNV
jgi:hypothetical protein